MSKKMTVACLGLGGMGGGLAHRLCELGWAPVVWNRSAHRAVDFAPVASRIAATPADAADGAEVALISLADEKAVEAVLFGPDGLAEALKPGAVVIDASTVTPAFSRDVTRRLAEIGVGRVEANVIANPAQARGGDARVFAAGEPETVARVREVLVALGRQLVELGAIGTASTMKLVLNSLLGAQLVSLAEAVSYGEKAGLDRDLLLRTIADSAFSSPVMSYRCGVMREERYDRPTFRAELMGKDLRFAVGDAAGHGLELPVIATAERRYQALVDSGRGGLDAAAILLQQLTDGGARNDGQA
ncbi:NAD(P)-dependent oxidoreductase [Actinoplanes sp. NPDC051346]|uniref:NAD(P)-dependent oxidoreductase n=1 Tax=Actinoplanes sp. NPDC051346 TaxID=3155048 RepID=UPI00342C0BBD